MVSRTCDSAAAVFGLPSSTESIISLLLRRNHDDVDVKDAYLEVTYLLLFLPFDYLWKLGRGKYEKIRRMYLYVCVPLTWEIHQPEQIPSQIS